MKKRDKVMLLIVMILLTVVFLGSTTYAYWKFEKTQEQSNVIVSQCFDLTFLEETDTTINLFNAYPMLDSEGRNLKPYVLHLTNHCENDLTYQMNLEVLKNSSLNDKYVKVMIGEKITLLNTLEVTGMNVEGAKSAYILEKGTIGSNSTIDLSLRMWLDGDISGDEVESMNKEFYSKVSVVGSINHYSGKYQESILNGTDPVLKGGLIPVIIADNGVVRKADETKEWYRYENKEWANAVILNDESIKYQNGEEIPESNIESYFVWIPRYRYQIFNDGMYSELSSSLDNNAVQEIKVVFESKEVVASDGVRKGQWLTHPAFTSFDTNGLWVGKFETGYKGSTDGVSSQVNQIEPEHVQIKPNVNSWRGIQVSNAFYSTYDYKRELDSHMMKNTEWGAISYLQHSKYGSMASVRINNNSSFVTGYSAVNEPTCGYTGLNEECNQHGTDANVTQAYNTATGYKASTTGNISGVYDMTGGAFEYVMGTIADKNGNPMSGRNILFNSGFNGTFGCSGSYNCDDDDSGLDSLTTGLDFPESKYYDLYPYESSDEKYGRRILGDATGEMGPFYRKVISNYYRNISSWYQDESWFVTIFDSWFVRGGVGYYGTYSGAFAYGNARGRFDNSYGFRVVLSV